MHITAVVPVYNEEKTIKNVIDTLNNCQELNQIIIVNDASIDNTKNILDKHFQNNTKIKIIHLKNNLGKSGAIKVACQNLKTDIIFFCDADLHNLELKHIKMILEPFYKNPNKLLMSAGIRDYGKITNFLSLYVYPLITGERALNLKIYKAIENDPLLKDYALELLLNNYCKTNNIPIIKQIMPNLKQTNKPYKRKNGIYLLLKQSLELTILFIKLQLRKLL